MILSRVHARGLWTSMHVFREWRHWQVKCSQNGYEEPRRRKNANVQHRGDQREGNGSRFGGAVRGYAGIVGRGGSRHGKRKKIGRGGTKPQPRSERTPKKPAGR